ncbi:MAG: hypothetical protein QXU18_09550 [Thermoplasmatales archaeon]
MLRLVEWSVELLFGVPITGGVDIFIFAMMGVCDYRKAAGKIIVRSV